MIKKLYSKDSSIIYEVINKAVRAYRGVIPEDCYHEPYMSEQELRHEVATGGAKLRKSLEFAQNI